VTFFESEEHEISVMLRHVVLLMTKARRNELAHLGITPPQIGVLHFAQKFKTPCTVIQLREMMRRSNSSLVAIINRLERKGLLKRGADSQSKKYTRIFLTEKGKDVYKKAVDLSAFNTIVSSLPEEDQQRLKSYLITLNDASQKILEEQ
jgi:DNA-binding MarR family transcriptional regulator